MMFAGCVFVVSKNAIALPCGEWMGQSDFNEHHKSRTAWEDAMDVIPKVDAMVFNHDRLYREMTISPDGKTQVNLSKKARSLMMKNDFVLAYTDQGVAGYISRSAILAIWPAASDEPGKFRIEYGPGDKDGVPCCAWIADLSDLSKMPGQ